MDNPDYCTLLRAAHSDANLSCATASAPASHGGSKPIQFHSQTHGFVELAGAIQFPDARLQLRAKVLLFAALHAFERRRDLLARYLAILVQHGLRQQVLVGLLQPSVELVEAHRAARILQGEDALEDATRGQQADSL